MRILTATLMLLCAGPALAEVKTGDRAIDFEKTTLDGKTVKLSQLRGKVVLLDFWASWCEPCKEELPILAKMAPRLRQQGIEIVAVNIDQNRANAESFLKQRALSLTVVHDSDQGLAGKYEPPKMPSSFLVDKSGVVRAVYSGFAKGDEGKIEKQLSAFAAAK